MNKGRFGAHHVSVAAKPAILGSAIRFQVALLAQPIPPRAFANLAFISRVHDDAGNVVLKLGSGSAVAAALSLRAQQQ